MTLSHLTPSDLTLSHLTLSGAFGRLMGVVEGLVLAGGLVPLAGMIVALFVAARSRAASPAAERAPESKP